MVTRSAASPAAHITWNATSRTSHCRPGSCALSGAPHEGVSTAGSTTRSMSSGARPAGQGGRETNARIPCVVASLDAPSRAAGLRVLGSEQGGGGLLGLGWILRGGGGGGGGGWSAHSQIVRRAGRETGACSAPGLWPPGLWRVLRLPRGSVLPGSPELVAQRPRGPVAQWPGRAGRPTGRQPLRPSRQRQSLDTF